MKLNVLVVDDSIVMRKMIIRTLRLSGLPIGAIHEAENGAEGLACLERHEVGVALVDVNMPVMNGEEMLINIRGNAATKALPVIIVSTESSSTRIASFQSMGAGFVHKPFSPEILREIVTNLTGVAYEETIEQGATQSSGPDF